MKTYKSSSVYQETTIPNPNQEEAVITIGKVDKSKPTKTKKKRRDKSDLGDNFVAPDGGWAWLVCIATGVSNLFIYPCLHQFGLIFRERLAILGLTSSEITTIINTNPAISACTGLLNGPMFRRYTFRQVALAGSLLIFSGLMMTPFCSTFVAYLLCYSILYGFGMGISISASSLALNTYFKVNRRRATGFSWTIMGLGPIFLPYLVTFLLSLYGVQGTVFIFAALSLHAFMGGLIYQPVWKHMSKPEEVTAEEPVDSPLCKYCKMQNMKNRGIFSSQYLYQDDDPDTPGYEIIEPGTPMLARANDGWFGSKLSLTSGKTRFRTVSSSKDLESIPRLKDTIPEQKEEGSDEHVEFFKPNNFYHERDEIVKHSNSKVSLKEHFKNGHKRNQLYCTCHEEQELLESSKSEQERQDVVVDSPIAPTNTTFAQKVVKFFDLGLLRDFTFVNLVAGLTIINFGELNFSLLMPFYLSDFGFNTAQISLAMSVLAGLDIPVRFLVPFFTEKIPWDNRVFFLIGVVGLAMGRTVVACTRSFNVTLIAFAWLGMCKGVRTVFWPLIIPGCVPLKRLPAASGLQLLITGLFTLAAGPFVGLVRDRYDYSVTLHCLNFLTFLAAFSWTAEALVRRYCKRRRAVVE